MWENEQRVFTKIREAGSPGRPLAVPGVMVRVNWRSRNDHESTYRKYVYYSDTSLGHIRDSVIFKLCPNNLLN
jgi:hypothetical protein